MIYSTSFWQRQQQQRVCYHESADPFGRTLYVLVPLPTLPFSPSLAARVFIVQQKLNSIKFLNENDFNVWLFRCACLVSFSIVFYHVFFFIIIVFFSFPFYFNVCMCRRYSICFQMYLSYFLLSFANSGFSRRLSISTAVKNRFHMREISSQARKRVEIEKR